ncbi:AraC family transcriptional regulator [Rhizobium sp. ERR 922]|uniref:AraC family transcriptional regulator n=1 Tax=unclassified Rhizobium TaxID=2613769 RepID=UPI0011A18483|nr:MULTISPECIES: AraC family transcriptional regulator [unclassified Rhizobium]TWB45539.1 AraC family transcriptional regulator [Rhizobium sp. ERR 922]TWB88226.1 AraC family transcriptional regulator [Rhizobium sp. ERR 942]
MADVEGTTGRQKDVARAWVEPSLGKTLFLDARYRTLAFERHYHEEFAIGIIESGCQAFSYDGGRRRMDMAAGSVALISPGIVHEGRPAGEAGWHYRMLYPSADIVKEAVSETGLADRPGSFHIPSVHDRQIFERIELLHHLSRSRHAEAMQIETLFIELMTQALHRHAGTAVASSPSHHRVGLGVARQLIEDGFEVAPSLDALAQAAGLSKFEFVRQFRREFGLPPHAYLRLVRVRRARDHISAGEALADSAMACGFADQAHMTRAFRRVLGITPGQFVRLRD